MAASRPKQQSGPALLLVVLSERVNHELLDACLRAKPQRWRRGDDSAQWSTLEHKQPTIE